MEFVSLIHKINMFRYERNEKKLSILHHSSSKHHRVERLEMYSFRGGVCRVDFRYNSYVNCIHFACHVPVTFMSRLRALTTSDYSRLC